MKNSLYISESNIKSIATELNKIDKVNISFDSNIDDKSLHTAVKIISELENNSSILVIYDIKTLSFDVKKRVVKAFLTNDNFQNDDAILNIINLIKNYNSLSDDFFKSEKIWFNSVTEFLDIKLDLKKELHEFITALTIWYLSLFQSIHKIEPNFLDKINNIPESFKKIFMTFDIFTLSGIISKSAKFSTDQLKIVNDAFSIVNSMMIKSAMSNQILNNIFDTFKLCNQ